MTERVKREGAAPVNVPEITLGFGVWLIGATVAGTLAGLACVAVVLLITAVGG